jgi:hypothetical protein
VVLAETRSTTPRCMGAASRARRGAECHSAIHGSGEWCSPRCGVPLRGPWERRVVLAEARSTTPRSTGAASGTRRDAEYHSAVHGSGEWCSPRCGVPLRGPWEWRVVLAEGWRAAPRSFGWLACRSRSFSCPLGQAAGTFGSGGGKTGLPGTQRPGPARPMLRESMAYAMAHRGIHGPRGKRCLPATFPCAHPSEMAPDCATIRALSSRLPEMVRA